MADPVKVSEASEKVREEIVGQVVAAANLLGMKTKGLSARIRQFLSEEGVDAKVPAIPVTSSGRALVGTAQIDAVMRHVPPEAHDATVPAFEIPDDLVVAEAPVDEAPPPPPLELDDPPDAPYHPHFPSNVNRRR